MQPVYIDQALRTLLNHTDRLFNDDVGKTDCYRFMEEEGECSLFQKEYTKLQTQVWRKGRKNSFPFSFQGLFFKQWVWTLPVMFLSYLINVCLSKFVTNYMKIKQ